MDQSLISLLEDFGLTAYEAKAYITLLEKGSLTVGEIAYHASIPRTKTYPTLKSLERKGLVIMNKSKPLRFLAISPEDCLKKIVDNEEVRVKKMKKALTELKKLQDESKKPLLQEEGKHLILGTSAIILKLRELISYCNTSIKCLIDSWGLRILDQVRDSLIQARSKGIIIKVISLNPLEEELIFLKGLIKYLKANFGVNLFLVDDNLLIVNSNSGKGLLIQSKDLSNNLLSNLFLEIWKRALDPEIYSIIVKLKNFNHYKILPELLIKYLIRSKDLEDLVKNFYTSLDPSKISTYDFINLISKVIWENCEINYDEFNGIIKMTINLKDLSFEQFYWLLLFLGHLILEGFNLATLEEESFITIHGVRGRKF
ncbi:hypothetical protein HRbin06_00078 [archaeon HR06]|nr:hypothetical protein HRbin06_00078 [archaeon HR06]